MKTPRAPNDLESLRGLLLRELPQAPLGDDLLHRYRANYHLPDDVEVTEAMALRHWELERSLTRSLLASTPDERPERFRRAYDELYAELSWLNQNEEETAGDTVGILAHDIASLVGHTRQRVLEVGGGFGAVLRHLRDAGHECWGSDLSEHRHPEGDDLRWLRLDAVTMELPSDQPLFDVVFSLQMVEHLHPDDLVPHLRAVHRSLAPGGRYFFTTPHAYFGPADMSAVFGATRPMGMHLKEYTYRELAAAAEEAGFDRVEAGFRWPLKLASMLGVPRTMRASRFYLRHLQTVERGLGLVPPSARRRVSRVLRALLFREVPLVASR